MTDADKELDDLLDSALDDFDAKPDPPIQVDTNKKSSNSKSEVTIEKTSLYVDEDYDDEDRKPSTSKPTKPASSSNQNKSNKIEDEMKMFEQIFSDEKTKQTFEQFTKAFAGMSGGEGEGDSGEGGGDVDEAKFMEQFQKVMTDMNLGDDDNENDDEDLQGGDLAKELDFLKQLASQAGIADPTASKPSTFSNERKSSTQDDGKPKTATNKLLDDLNKNSEKVLKNNNAGGSGSSDPGNFLSSLLQSAGGLANEGGGDGDGDEASMMEPVLSMLFSKEILYPSLKMMSDNYDKYIEEKKEKMAGKNEEKEEKEGESEVITEETIKKLLDQHDCIKEMCQVYENSNASTDSKEAKSEQLKKILDLLEKCGMPPSELVPEVNPFEALGSLGGPGGCPIS